MDREQVEVVGAAFLAGLKAGRGSESRTAPGYERPLMVHKVPRCRIRLDGESCQPNIVQKFDGKPLYYVLDRAAMESGEVSIFTRPDYAKEFRESDSRALEEAPTNNDEVGVSAQALRANLIIGGYVGLYEHIDYGGAEWTFWASWGNIPNFRAVYPTLWWSSDINDRVSSVETNIATSEPSVKAWTVLYQHINYRGSQLWISNDGVQDFQEGPGLVRTLVPLGWNDIASSMSYEV